MKNNCLSRKSVIVLILLPVICGFFSLCVGRYFIPVGDVFKALFCGVGDFDSKICVVLWNIRLPRVLMALIVGAGLSVAGCVFQSLFANPLATPDTLGIASGSSFGAVLGILLGFANVGIMFFSFCFGVIGVFLSYLGSFTSGKRLGHGSLLEKLKNLFSQENNRSTIILAGIMISSLFSALISLVKYLADSETVLPNITYWLMGSFASSSYKQIAFGLPVIFVGIFVLFVLRWRLNLLILSRDEAVSCGVNVFALRLVAVICGSAITAACVSMCGQVGWIGLIVPHLCRMKFGNNHIKLIPACVCVGSGFMVITDCFARSLSASEIPVSILTAIIGAPFFIYLIRKSGGWNL